MIQIASGYYSIPIGDFLYTSSRTNSISVLFALGLLVLIILGKDILIENFDFMKYDLFRFNFLIVFSVIMSFLCFYVFRRFGLLRTVVLACASFAVMLFGDNISLFTDIPLNVNLLFFIL